MIEQTNKRGKVVGFIYQQNKICEGFMQKKLLSTLSMKQSEGANEELLLAMNRIVRAEESVLDVRRGLDFIASLGWAKVHKDRGSSWFATVTEKGLAANKKMHEAFMRKTYQQ